MRISSFKCGRQQWQGVRRKAKSDGPEPNFGAVTLSATSSISVQGVFYRIIVVN